MPIQKGNTVKIEYEGRLEDGQVFDSSSKDGEVKPIEFTIGEGKVIPGFEQGVLGMDQGQEKEITLEPDQAYGQPRDDLQKQIPRDQLPPEQEPKEGMMVAMATPDGKQIPAKIVKVDDKNITIVLNHPLAGKKLIFKVKIVSVN